MPYIVNVRQSVADIREDAATEGAYYGQYQDRIKQLESLGYKWSAARDEARKEFKALGLTYSWLGK